MYGFCGVAALPRSGLTFGTRSVCTRTAGVTTEEPVFAPGEIRAAKHVQKKATKKHMDRRPKKSRPSDRNRKPVPYDVDPLHTEGMPSEYTVLGVVDGEEKPIEIVEQFDTITTDPVIATWTGQNIVPLPLNPPVVEKKRRVKKKRGRHAKKDNVVEKPVAEVSEPEAEAEPAVEEPVAEESVAEESDSTVNSS